MDLTGGFNLLKDSGDRREFGTGAVRDMGGGKGRCDLLPASALIGFARFCDNAPLETKEPREAIKEVLFRCFKYLDSFNKSDLYFASYYLMFTIEAEEHGFDITAIREPFPACILHLSKYYEQGAKKYSDRNWEKGIPISVMLDSGIRHTLKYLDGRTDEDHLVAALWNVLGAIWMLQNRPEMMDLGKGRVI